MQCLIAFSHSPRLEHAFGSQLTLITVPPSPSRVVVLPHESSKWEAISGQIVPPCDTIGGKWRETEAESLVQRFSNQEKTNAPIHCECALIAYLTRRSRLAKGKPQNKKPSKQPIAEECQPHGTGHPDRKPTKQGNTTGRQPALSKAPIVTDRWKDIVPFSYIGVSKLSCSPCQIWIQGYNKVQGPKFYTRGSHGKWYWPWGIAQLDEIILSRHMVTEVSNAYYELCRMKHRIRRTSDGSNAPIDLGRAFAEETDEEVCEDYFDED